MVLSQSGPWPAVNWAAVIGSSSSDEAKIGGMTPEELSFKGRCEAVALEHAVADLALGVLDQQPPLRPLHEDDGADDEEHQRQQSDQETHRQRSGAGKLEQADERRRQACDDACEDDERDAVADAALR